MPSSLLPRLAANAALPRGASPLPGAAAAAALPGVPSPLSATLAAAASTLSASPSAVLAAAASTPLSLPSATRAGANTHAATRSWHCALGCFCAMRNACSTLAVLNQACFGAGWDSSTVSSASSACRAPSSLCRFSTRPSREPSSRGPCQLTVSVSRHSAALAEARSAWTVSSRLAYSITVKR